MKELLVRMVLNDEGQDLIEYAVLTAFIGIAGMAAFNLIATTMNTTYGSWDTGINSLWEPADPL